MREPAKNELGVLKKIERVEDDDGKIVFRATVDFYDGNAPPCTFGTVWGRKPVTIIEALDDQQSGGRK